MSSKKSTASKDKATKRSRKPRPPVITQVDDPIIIKGRSLTIQFDDDGKWRRDTAVNPKHKFDHLNSSKRLERIVILDSDGNEKFRHALDRGDEIIICYTRSFCI